MTNLVDVLSFMRPDDQFVCYGENLNETVWHNDCIPVTEEEYKTGKTAYEKSRKTEAATKAAEKAALLAKLGITEDEARLLLG